jgi:hypothetical protein
VAVKAGYEPEPLVLGAHGERDDQASSAIEHASASTCAGASSRTLAPTSISASGTRVAAGAAEVVS